MIVCDFRYVTVGCFSDYLSDAVDLGVNLFGSV